MLLSQWIAPRLGRLVTRASLSIRMAMHRRSARLEPQSSNRYLLDRLPPIVAALLLTRADELQIWIARLELRILITLRQSGLEESSLGD